MGIPTLDGSNFIVQVQNLSSVVAIDDPNRLDAFSKALGSPVGFRVYKTK